MRFRQWGIFAVVAAALFGVNYLLEENIDPYVVRVITNCGIALILALSLNLINGCAGQFSLGHAGFYAVGAYASATLTTVFQLEFFHTSIGIGIAVVVGGLVASVAGYLVGLPSLRLKGDYLAIVTLGFGEIIRIIFLNIEAVGGARGLPAIPRTSNFFWVYLWAFVTFVALYRLIQSSTGRAILSIRENEIAAESMGIDVAHYKIVAFVISSFFAGIAGALYAHFQGQLDPGKFDFSQSVMIVIMVVIGGMGSLSGAMIGAVIVSTLPELLRPLQQYRLVVFPLLLIMIMLLRPTGIMGRQEVWNLRWFHRKKKVFNESGSV